MSAAREVRRGVSEFKFGKLLGADEYAKRYMDGFGFESVCALARQQRNVRFLEDTQPQSILEIGCGSTLLAGMKGIDGLAFIKWVIVEPASQFARNARELTSGDDRFSVIEDYLEGAIDYLRPLVAGGFDCVIVSGLVHETMSPELLLDAAISLIKPQGRALVSAPNAMSFHRLLAVESGLINSPYELSSLNRQLGHPVVFDRHSLAKLLVASGLTDLVFDGYIFKPFTNTQMATMLNVVGDQLINGLIELGRKFPDNAAEICITGKRI